MNQHIRLLETIKVKDGKALHLSFHQERMNEARLQLWQQQTILSLKDKKIPQLTREGIFKWRIVYGAAYYKDDFLPYSPKIIRSLKLVEANDLDYNYKYENRTTLNHLSEERRGNCDDILILKNGEITDTSFANIVFFDGANWFTPKNPLLRGTKRARLLLEKRIHEMVITSEDLHQFSSFKIINAMLDFEETEKIGMKYLIP